MSIDIKQLKESDKGKWVIYLPGEWADKEKGKIKSWNSSFIFVVYNCDNDWDNYKNYTAAATKPNDLNFL